MGALLKRFSISRRKAAMHEQIEVSLIGRLVHDLIRLGLAEAVPRARCCKPFKLPCCLISFKGSSSLQI